MTLRGGSGGEHGQVLEGAGLGEDGLFGEEGCVGGLGGGGGWAVEEKEEGGGMDQVWLIQHELVDGSLHVQDGGLGVQPGVDVEQGEAGYGDGLLGGQQQVLGGLGQQHWGGQQGGGGQQDGQCGGQLYHGGLDADEAGGGGPRGAAQP